MRDGRCQLQEVAAKVSGEPRSRAHVLESKPTRGVDARSECAAVEKATRFGAAERGRRRIEPEHDRVVPELDGDEPDARIER